MNFDEIIEQWQSLEEKDPTAAMEAKAWLVGRLLAPEGQWFNACVEWLEAGPAPCDQNGQLVGELDRLLDWAERLYCCGGRNTGGYIREAALAHINCARVAACARELRQALQEKVGQAARKLVEAAASAVTSGADFPNLASAAQQLQETWQHSSHRLAHRAFEILPEGIEEQSGLDTGFLRELTGALAAKAAGTDGPVARQRDAVFVTRAFFATVPTVRTSSQEAGEELLRFEVEVLAEGSGEVLIAPEEAFVAWDSEFRESYRQARDALSCFFARNPDEEIQHANCDFRVRVLDSCGRLPKWDILGPSAGGALARALYFAATGKAADDEIVVMAEVQNGGLSGIGGIKEKVEAIKRWNDEGREPRLDTIVVASEENRREALHALAGRTDLDVWGWGE